MMGTNDFIKAIPWLLPVVLLFLKFGLKLWISEQHSSINLWKGILQSPVDVGFLSLSLIASAIIRAAGNQNQSNHETLVTAFVIFIIYIFLIILSIVLWKTTPTTIAKKEICIAVIVGLLNYLLTIGMLVYGILLIKPL